MSVASRGDPYPSGLEGSRGRKAPAGEGGCAVGRERGSEGAGPGKEGALFGSSPEASLARL
jgi:hypothetical protein